MLKLVNYDTWLLFLIVLLSTIILITYILRILVNKKIISSNKFTRSIYQDNDSLKEEWPRIKNRGVYRYILRYVSIFGICIFVLNLIGLFIFNEPLSETFLGTTIAQLIGVCIGAYFNWCRTEDRYIELVK